MKIFKTLTILCCSATVASSLFATETIESLMKGYFDNSLTISSLSADYENQILQNKTDKISNGISFKLSTGNVRMQFGEKNTISFVPSASVSIPQADNLSFGVSSNIELGDESNITGTSLSLTADIYSDTMKKRKITLEKSERNLLEIKRDLLDCFISTETDFYKEIKNLYEIASKIESAQNSAYEDKLDFEQVKAKGYTETSSKYRLAQMKVISDEYKVEQYEHELKREVELFAAKCGKTFTGDNIWDFLPSEIPQVQEVNVDSFKKENFVKIENAEWKHEINQKTRDADKAVTVTANAGYTFKNEIRNDQYSDTIDAGTSVTWNGTGLTANLGVSLPVDDFNPVYKFSVSVVPNQFRLAPITQKQKELEEKKELISIQSAENDYETTVIKLRNELNDIKFNKQKNIETYELYNALESDMALYYSKGIISESEYRTAQVNKENYRIQCLINDIELIIYNNEVKQYFTKDEELMK